MLLLWSSIQLPIDQDWFSAQHSHHVLRVLRHAWLGWETLQRLALMLSHALPWCIVCLNPQCVATHLATMTVLNSLTYLGKAVFFRDGLVSTRPVCHQFRRWPLLQSSSTDWLSLLPGWRDMNCTSGGGLQMHAKCISVSGMWDDKWDNMST